MYTNENVSYLFAAPLAYGGFLHVGREIFGKGMQVGTPRLVARLEIPRELGDYPEGWFPLERDMSLLRLRKDFPDNGTKGGYLTEWLLLACYRYHYEQLKSKVALQTP